MKFKILGEEGRRASRQAGKPDVCDWQGDGGTGQGRHVGGGVVVRQSSSQEGARGERRARLYMTGAAADQR